MRNAKAFVFAAEEDFGITPVEAQACGTPIIAFGKGGALETVVGKNAENPTGVFFEEQKIESVVTAVNSFEREQHIYTPENCRLNALKFSTDRFNQEFSKYIEDKWNLFHLSKN